QRLQVLHGIQPCDGSYDERLRGQSQQMAGTVTIRRGGFGSHVDAVVDDTYTVRRKTFGHDMALEIFGNRERLMRDMREETIGHPTLRGRRSVGQAAMLGEDHTERRAEHSRKTAINKRRILMTVNHRGSVTPGDLRNSRSEHRMKTRLATES